MNANFAIATLSSPFTQYPDIHNYSLIINVEDIVFLYRPEHNRVILISVRGIQPQKLIVTSFAVSAFSLAIEKLEGVISGLLQVDYVQHQRATGIRVVRLTNVFVKLYPIRASTSHIYSASAA